MQWLHLCFRAHEEYGFCQAGTSGVLTDSEELVAIGAPGPYTWRGAIFVSSISDDFLSRLKTTFHTPVTESDSPVDKYAYLGESFFPLPNRNRRKFKAPLLYCVCARARWFRKRRPCGVIFPCDALRLSTFDTAGNKLLLQTIHPNSNFTRVSRKKINKCLPRRKGKIRTRLTTASFVLSRATAPV